MRSRRAGYLLVDDPGRERGPYDLLKRLARTRQLLRGGRRRAVDFTWTGADPYVLVRFSRDYEIERPIVLDKNCRCSRQIFETARRVLDRTLSCSRSSSARSRSAEYEVGAFAFRDEAEEASWLLEDIQADRTAAGWVGATMRCCTAGTRSASTSRDAWCKRDSLPAGARPFAGGGRRHQVCWSPRCASYATPATP